MELCCVGEKAEKELRLTVDFLKAKLKQSKNLVEAAEAAKHCGFKLKIVGEAVGFSKIKQELEKIEAVELVGRVSDRKMMGLYAKAKGFIALAKDEDFGMTPLEGMAAGKQTLTLAVGGIILAILSWLILLLIENITGSPVTQFNFSFQP